MKENLTIINKHYKIEYKRKTTATTTTTPDMYLNINYRFKQFIYMYYTY